MNQLCCEQKLCWFVPNLATRSVDDETDVTMTKISNSQGVVARNSRIHEVNDMASSVEYVMHSQFFYVLLLGDF